MSRQLREFKSFKDFNENSTPKQSLASLCVSVRKILMPYQACDDDIQRDLLESNAVGEVAKLSLQRRHGERKKRVEEILNACYDRRGHVELPEASDIFLDIRTSRW